MNDGSRVFTTGWKPEYSQDGCRQDYVLYEWLGKIKWCYLCGVYLVDPKYEQEFMKEHRVH